MKKIISIILATVLIFGFGSVLTMSADAVSLSTKSVKLVKGEEEFIMLDGADNSKVEWDSSNEKVAVVEDGVICGVSKGSATVTAEYRNKSYKCKVTVSDYRVEREKDSVMVGNRLKLELKGWSGEREWKSSDESVATVGADGILRGVSAGRAKISVSFNGKKLNFSINVTDYNFPVSASKTAYIKVTHEGKYGKKCKTEFITDKDIIKAVLKYADNLEYSFIEPEEARELSVKGYELAEMRYGSEKKVQDSFIFYDDEGIELGRFETSLCDSIDNNIEGTLGYFYYTNKCYRVIGTNNIMNEAYGWMSTEELIETANELYGFDEEDDKLSVEFSYVIDTEYVTEDGIIFMASYQYDSNDCEIEVTEIFLDPATGEETGIEVLRDE